jgi:hypothetical protein
MLRQSLNMVEHRLRPGSRFDSGLSKADCLQSVFEGLRWVMDDTQKLAVFQAQVENVRALESAIGQIRRNINFSLRHNASSIANSLTKLYAVLFCAWAEANFSKVVHTPYGFSIDEIGQIQTAKSAGITAAWKKAVELGLRHLDASRGSFQPNTRLRLFRAIDAHVFDPSLLRNKLAHGQWVIALNRSNDGIQAELTTLIEELDIVQVDGWRFCHQHLAQMIETLIESPKKAFVRDWWVSIVDLDNEMEQASKKPRRTHRETEGKR